MFLGEDYSKGVRPLNLISVDSVKGLGGDRKVTDNRYFVVSLRGSAPNPHPISLAREIGERVLRNAFI